jgi:site-specific DNA-methyltransferase (adenine-specific)
MPGQKKHELHECRVADLIPYANNSRIHSDEQVAQVAASIQEYGFTNPVLIDEDNGVIAGHGRLQAAKKLGMDVVPCITLKGLTKAQKKAYVIVDNSLALNASWNEDLLRLEVQSLKELDYDLDLLGLDNIGDLLIDPGAGKTDDDAVPDTPETAITEPGDIWLLGEHRLVCGDSTDIDVVKAAVNGQAVDLLMTDPPYNVAYTGKTKDALTIENDSMSDHDFRQFLHDAYTAANAVMKPGAVFYIWHANTEADNFIGAAKDVSWVVRQCLIWKKQTMVMGRQDYQWQHEPCIYGWKGGAAHLWASDRKQTTILEFDRPMANKEHPTMKPVDMLAYLIGNNTKGGDIVLDTFGGSGSTLIACDKTGRISRLVELDPIYCDVIINRWQNYTGQQAVHADGRLFNEMDNG